MCRYTVKVQRELKLDVRALDNLKADRRRFLLKAVENYTRCLALGEEHDTWVFRLASLWLENADTKDVNDLMIVSDQCVQACESFNFRRWIAQCISELLQCVYLIFILYINFSVITVTTCVFWLIRKV